MDEQQAESCSGSAGLGEVDQLTSAVCWGHPYRELL